MENLNEKETANKENSVNHLAVIIDGNRRYAKSKGLPTYKGHEAGADTVEKLVEWCQDLKIKELSIYTLSTENLKRDKIELDYLFALFKRFFKKFKTDKRIKENQVKIKFIGDLSLIPKDIKKLAEEIQEDTKNYNNYKLNFCFSYGGRLELINAFNKLKSQSQNKEITEQDITNALWLKTEPDLIIRTGGKMRTSNFLPWQSVYSEWIFLEKMWPAFTKEDLIDCLEKFKNIQRNFGK